MHVESREVDHVKSYINFNVGITHLAEICSEYYGHLDKNCIR